MSELSREEKVEQLKKQTESRRYKDEKQKNYLANKVVFIGFIVTQVVIAINISACILNYGNSILSDIGLAVDALGIIAVIILYFRNRSSKLIFNIGILQIVLLYIVVGIVNKNNCMMFIPFPLMVTVMMYSQPKLTKIACYLFAAADILRFVLLNTNVVPTSNTMAEETLVFGLVLVTLFAIDKSTKVLWKFNNDSLGAVKDEEQMMKLIMEDVLEIAKGVQNQTGEANVLLDELYNS